ncbi:MAG: hypothetical protein U0Y10_18590 [Spirosomataceae bacterium]
MNVFKLRYAKTLGLQVFLFGQLTSAKAQFFTKDSTHKKIFDFTIDRRKSIVNQESVAIDINGLNVGWTRYKGRIRLGIGGYFIFDKNPKATQIRYQNKNTLVQRKTNIYYLTPNISYKFYRSKWLDLAIPFELGLGYSDLTQTDYLTGAVIPVLKKDGTSSPTTEWFVPAQLGLWATVNLSPDVALVSSIGYRKILTSSGLNIDYDGLYYSFGLKLIPNRILKDFKNDLTRWKQRKQNAL